MRNPCAPIRGNGVILRARGRSFLFSTALAGIVAGLASPAAAQAVDECGPAEQGAVTCTSAGNPFANGIEYSTPAADPTRDPGLDPAAPVYDLTVNLESEVAVQRADGAGVTLTGINDGSVSLNAATGSSIAVTGVGSIGVLASTNTGDLTINTQSITATGDAGGGINAVSNGGDVTIISNGAISTTGEFAPGVYAVAATGGNASVTVNDVSTDGFGSNAIVARGDAVDVTINGDIRTSDYASRGVYAFAYDGSVTVTNNGTIETARGGGNGIVAVGSDGAIINSTGTIVTNGPSATGIYADGGNGPTTVTAASVVTSGAYSRGVIAQGSGDVTVDLGDVTTNGSIGSAIEVATFQNGTGPLDADLAVTVDNVTANGDYSSGINAFSSNNGVLDIDAGTITVNGANGIGILSESFTADIDINVGTVVTTGTGTVYAGPSGISASSGSGNIAITSSNLVSTEGLNGTGIFAATAGDVAIEVNDVSTQGDGAAAIAAAGGNTSVTINGDVATAGANAPGVYALGQTGSSIVANNGTVTTGGANSNGIIALAYGDVTVSGTGAVRSSGTGLDLYSLAGDITAGQASIVTTGDGADGIHAETANALGTAGNITIDTGAITTSGNAADGIDASAMSGGNIVIDHGTIGTSGDESFGVAAIGLYDVTISGSSVTTAGYNAAGVYGVAILGNASVTNTGTISTVGDYSPGALAASYFGNAAVDANAISTQGYSSDAAFATAFYGDAAVSVNTVSTAGDASVGVRVEALYDASATVRGSATTAGAYSDAVRVLVLYGGATVTNSGTILTTGLEANGIDAEGGAGGVTISGTGSVGTRGDFSTAIVARSTYGPVAVTSGSVTTSGFGAGGIDVYGAGGVAVDVTNVSTTGGESTGIAAGGSYSVSVTADTIRTTGEGANGINAASFGGDVLIDVGSVRTSGADTTAIRAFGFGGGVDASVAGAVRSDSGVGMRLLAGGVGGGGNIGLGDPALDGLAQLTVASGGSVTGGTDAVVIESVNGAVVNNAGTITGGSGYALRIAGGRAGITNNGAISGQLLLTGGNDTLNNSGALTLAGASDFGAGTDVLTNSGTIRLAATDAAQTVSVAGLETLNSSGAINLRNGVAGDRLTFANTAYTGSGNATLGLDIAFANGAVTSDQLVLGSASGSTAVSLAVSGTPTLIAPTAIIDVTGATGANAFTIAPEASDFGLVTFGVAYSAADTSYQLVSAPSGAVYRQAQLGEALTTLWNRSADAVSAHLTASRDATWAAEPEVGAGRFWFQTLGETNRRKGSQSFNYLGLAQNNVDLGYRQDAFGAQFGADLVGGSPEGGFTAGLSGGYLNSTTRFSAGNGDRFNVDAFNVGVYAGFRGGPLFVNGLAKYDLFKVDRHSYLTALNGSDDGHALGGKVEVGLRLGSASFFAEPLASVAYSRTSLDDFTVGGNAFDYDRFHGLRGKAGVRIGGTTNIGGSTMVFYLAGAAVKEFEGRDGLRFTSGSQVVDLRSDRLGTYGQGTLGLNVTMTSGVSGFIEGHGEYGDDYRGGGGRAGLRIRF